MLKKTKVRRVLIDINWSFFIIKPVSFLLRMFLIAQSIAVHEKIYRKHFFHDITGRLFENIYQLRNFEMKQVFEEHIRKHDFRRFVISFMLLALGYL